MNPSLVTARQSQRGFTLIELMVAVAVLGVLAALAVPAFTRSKRKARTKDVEAMFAAIATAQETYHQFNGDYYGLDDTWQGPEPSNEAHTWTAAGGGGAADTSVMQALGIQTSGTTWFQYLIVGGSGNTCGAGVLPATLSPCASLTAGDWWYAAARGNQDGDGTFSYFVTHSMAAGEIFRQDELE